MSLAFLRLAPTSHIAEPGKTVHSYSLVGANEFRRSGPVDEDAETWRLGLTFSRGLSDGLEVFGEVPLYARGGGVMDSIIDWWHAAVISQNYPVREATPPGRSVISNPSGGPFHSAIGIGDLTVGIAKRVAAGTIVRSALKLPTGNAAQLLGSGAVDLGAAVDVQLKPAPAWTLDLNAGISFQGDATRLTGTRRAPYSSSIALTYVQSSRDAWTIQWNTEQAPTRTGLEELDQDHRTMSFGYQRLLPDGSVFQAYFSEDGDFLHFPGGPTLGPDFTIGLRLIVRR